MGTGNGNGKWEIRGKSCDITGFPPGLTWLLRSLKAVISQLLNVYGFPISHSYTKMPRINDHFDIFILIINTVLAKFFKILSIFSSTMVQLIEGTHYRRRENQPSPAPHKSKEVVDCLLCIDPGDDDDAHGDQTRRKRSGLFFGNVRKKRSRPIGQSIRHNNYKQSG